MPTPLIRLTLPRDRYKDFHLLLQAGVRVSAETGQSLRAVLEALGIAPDYITERIQTAFVNGSPADDFDEAQVTDGTRVTLSAALPGLLGATMRKEGFYARMREGISLGQADQQAAKAAGHIQLKLLNLVLPELAPLVLEQGLEVPAKQLADFLDYRGQEFVSLCKESTPDKDLLEKILDPAYSPEEYIRIQVSAA